MVSQLDCHPWGDHREGKGVGQPHSNLGLLRVEGHTQLARLLKQASNIGEMTVALLGEGALNDHLRYTMAALAVRTLSSSRKS
jgi:hypothetical protein